MICTGCVFLERYYRPLQHDLAPQGCRHDRWAGYVLDVTSPPCGGLAFAPLPPVTFRHLEVGKHGRLVVAEERQISREAFVRGEEA